PQRQEPLLLQPLDRADPVHELRRVVGHVAARAHRLRQEAFAQVVLDRARRDAGGVGELAHLQPGLLAHATAPAARSASISPAAKPASPSTASVSAPGRGPPARVGSAGVRDSLTGVPSTRWDPTSTTM